MSQKNYHTFESKDDVSSTYSYSILSEKERANALLDRPEKKKSRFSRIVEGELSVIAIDGRSCMLTTVTAIKNIEPPEPVLPQGRLANRSSMPAWSR